MLPPDDPFLTLFEQTFYANYHPDLFQDETELKNIIPQATPLSFYDRHIAPRFILKNVVYLPSVVQSISKACDRTVRKFLHDGHKFCKSGYTFSLPPKRRLFRDAHTTSTYYYKFSANLAIRYAYKFVIHPERESWDSPFRFIEARITNELLFATEAYLTMTNRLKDLPELMLGLTEATEGKLLDLLRRFPRLATWQMFAMTDTATSMLQTSTRSVLFRWESCVTQGCRILSSLQPAPDAKISLIPLHALKKPKPYSGSLTRNSPIIKAAKTIKVPERPSESKKYRADFRHYIQHAWATAAIHDSTFMIFQCGRYERIGFRHRATQTLYLSGVIDSVNMKDPPYRKLQIGLHTAIVKDALDRQEELLKAEARDNCNNPDDKGTVIPHDKPFENTQDSEADTIEIYDEIAERDLALAILDYGAFCSPAPSSFLRVGPSCVPGHAEQKTYPTQRRFNDQEYISLVLEEPLGQGAVGVAHPAVVTVVLESGETVKRNMVIKLAFTVEQRFKLYDEYRVYGHLSFKEGLEGIVTVHGLFKDPESGALGMLMDNAGCSLRRREIERGGDGRQVTTSSEEKEAFKRVLKGLHEAGVRHHDIRADNLLINSRNEVFIIDLDCADYQVSKANREHEMECLDGSPVWTISRWSVLFLILDFGSYPLYFYSFTTS